MNGTRPQRVLRSLTRRLAQVATINERSERIELAQRLARRAYHMTGASALESTLLARDVVDSDSVTWARPTQKRTRGEALTVGWLTTAPSPGSGGHTTLFRMIEGLEHAGHSCVVYLYDPHNSPVGFHESVIREHWPSIRAEVRDIRTGLVEADAFFATSWQTAHILGGFGSTAGHRFYFVQDYEPFFYPQGSEYFLAEDTYRFGYRTVVIGGMIADMLKSQHGVTADRIQFGCDTKVYSRRNHGPRNGVVFYAKPEVARRGFLLGMAALERFHQLHPEHEIHLFGTGKIHSPFPCTIHGTLSPKELSELYNLAVTGIALSFSNMSLVPYEMLACGAVPVVNESDHGRAELTNPEVLWTRPTPSAIAENLSNAVRATNADLVSAQAAEGIRDQDWISSQRAFAQVVEREVYQS